MGTGAPNPKSFKPAAQRPGAISTTPDPAAPAEGRDPEPGQVRFLTLRELGLTEYQAKAYLALLRLGRGTAAQVARVTDVPRNKLYPVMQQLNQLGLVETLLGEAQVFRPLPPDRFLHERLDAMRAQVRDLDARRDALAELFKPTPREPEVSAASYRLYHGRANALRQLRGALRGARTQLFLLGTPATARRLLASGAAELLREKIDDGALAVVVVPSSPGDAASQELAALLGEALAVLPQPTPPCEVLSVDGALCIQAQVQPDDGSTERGSDVCLVSESPILAAAMAHYVRTLWQAARQGARAPAAEPGRGGREPEAPSPGPP